MTIDIIKHDIKALLDAWIQAEDNGVEFPVPFNTAWRIAEFSSKGNTRKKLPKHGRVKLYIEKDKKSTGGRPEKEISLTLDCLKHLLRDWVECLDAVVDNSTRQIWMGE